ncbi:MAG: LysR family transcriptional regulator [Desulfovibrio sp.]|uniref:LysR family transcriptional regulator n=1 Tax=Desulfovibrio sp. TaxID=885 RepID=UPI00135E343A|nr:LysR family transcriptional regulator [Desulfovibrio sp.]MTJ94154.1 LysR family transcriptional regulator [Desulfovibrio sp.]
MQLTLRQIEAFLTVANLRSFTAAGASLHITQSAVSNLIKDLETQVGVPLFDRTSRSVALSPDGRELYTLAQKAFHEFLLMEKYAADLSSLRSGRVRVVGAPLIACTLLPLLMAHFKRVEPGIRVELVDQPMALLQSSIQQGDAEVGFGPARLPEADIRVQHFFTTPVCMLSRPDHPLADRHSSWAEVKEIPVIAVGRESVGYIAADVGTEPPFTLGHVVNQMPTAFALAAAGCGVALAGRFSLMLARGYGLVATLLHEPVLHRDMLMYLPAVRRLSDAATTFVDFALQFVKDHDPNTLDTATVAELAPPLCTRKGP